MQHLQVTVRYRVEGDHAHFRAEMTKSAPAIASVPGLVRNMWSLDPDSGLGTSVYLFDSEAAAQHFLAGPTLEHLLNGPASAASRSTWPMLMRRIRRAVPRVAPALESRAAS